MEVLAIENDALVDCIRNYPAIYDKKLQGLQISTTEKNTWKVVTRKLGMEIESTLWQHVNRRMLVTDRRQS